jgi:hypothetical protein
MRALFISIKTAFRRWRLKEGRLLSQFIARDVRRDILIVSARRVEEGFISARVRTFNCLYVASDIASLPDFGPVEEIQIDSMWHWTGADWGGLPDGSSIATTTRADVCAQTTHRTVDHKS